MRLLHQTNVRILVEQGAVAADTCTQESNSDSAMHRTSNCISEKSSPEYCAETPQVCAGVSLTGATEKPCRA